MQDLTKARCARIPHTPDGREISLRHAPFGIAVTRVTKAPRLCEWVWAA
jgi:hypothetical protein